MVVGAGSPGLSHHDRQLKNSRCLLSSEVFADDESPFFHGGFFDIAAAVPRCAKIVNAFKSDGALAWHEHMAACSAALQRIFRDIISATLAGPLMRREVTKRGLADDVVADVEYALGAARTGSHMFVPGQRAIRFERVTIFGTSWNRPLAISKKPAMKNGLSSSANTIACSGDSEIFELSCRR